MDLPFWYDGPQHQYLSAGFGPYALTRLCAETQGLFLIASSGRNRVFDPTVMREYLPDYRPIKYYTRDVKSNPAKMALTTAAHMTHEGPVYPPKTVFRADSDNVLRTEVTEAQEPFAVLDYKLRQIQQILERGTAGRALHERVL